MAANPELSSPKPLGTKCYAFARLVPYANIAPFYLLFLIFGLFPIAFSAVLAFSHWDGLGDITFIGWANFAKLLHDDTFWLALKNTLIIWGVGTFPMLAGALVLAYFISLKFIKHRRLLEVLFFLPNVTSIVAITLLFGLIFSNVNGLANNILSWFGIAPIAWLKTPLWLQLVIASVNMWQYLGYNMLLYLTGITKIPKSLFEVAALAGTSRWQTFRFVIIPQLRPIILFTLIMSTIGGLQVFTEAQVLAPNASAEGGALTVVYYLYTSAFQDHQYGYGAAIAWALVMIILFFSGLNWLVNHKLGGHKA